VKAHVEAGRREHVTSDGVEARLVAVLGNPSTCPHGNPIPGGPPATDHQVALAEVATDSRIRLARVTERVEVDSEPLQYLSESGFLPGKDAIVLAKDPEVATTLEIDGSTVAFGPALSRQLYVVVPTAFELDGATIRRAATARPGPDG
jgi:DtxR family Mn-dependent transcriptional regulator